MKYVAIGIVAVPLALATGFGMNHLFIKMRGSYDKALEQNRTEVFKQSQAYLDGMQRELNRLMVEYRSSDPAGKVGIANAVRDMYSQTDTSNMPDHLQSFLKEVNAR